MRPRIAKPSKGAAMSEPLCAFLFIGAFLTLFQLLPDFDGWDG